MSPPFVLSAFAQIFFFLPLPTWSKALNSSSDFPPFQLFPTVSLSRRSLPPLHCFCALYIFYSFFHLALCFFLCLPPLLDQETLESRCHPFFFFISSTFTWLFLFHICVKQERWKRERQKRSHQVFPLYFRGGRHPTPLTKMITKWVSIFLLCQDALSTESPIC